MKRSVTVNISQFAVDALVSVKAVGAEGVRERLVQAIRLYLGDKHGEHPGWTYPVSLRERVHGGVDLELSDVEEDLWDALEREAARQGVSLSQLAEHAALYYVAELDSGRITQRILEGEEPPGEN